LLGLVTLFEGNADEARRLLADSLRIALEVRNTFFLARICTFLAELALWEGDIDQGAKWLAQSLAYQRPQQHITLEEVQRLWLAARLATVQQQTLRAAALFGMADQAHSQVHHAITGPLCALADATLATVRAALDPARFTETFAAGQHMTLAEAFAAVPGTLTN
jgi:hypothetical protein